jgi:quinolinate synthase
MRRLSCLARKTPEALAVTYINSSAEVKAISDVIVTSSNAQKIVESIPRERQIFFGPDQHLGRFLSQKLNREFICGPALARFMYCFTQRNFIV